MAFNTLKKLCPYCQKSFLTNDKDMVFCNTLCEAKTKYNKHFNLESKKHKTYLCKNCGTETSRAFCDKYCEKSFMKKDRLKKSGEVFLKDKKKNLKPLPYDVLNKIAERKRVFQDSRWLYNKVREKI